MSSGCGDVLSLEDLKTAKLHQVFEAEVITGFAGGVAGGASIDYATNPVTGQVQKTMPATLRDLGYEPASFDFSSGGTLTVNDRNKAVLWPLASGGDGTYYYWEGALPKVIPASSTPASTGGVGAGSWKQVGDLSLRTQLATAGNPNLVDDSNIKVQSAAAGGVIRTQHDKNAEYLSIKDFGAVGNGVTDDTAAFQAAFSYMAAGGAFTLNIPGGRYILSSKLNLTNTAAASVKIIGAGSEGTILDWNSSAAGLSFVSSDSGDWWLDVAGSTPLALHLEGFTLVNRGAITNIGLEIRLKGVTGRPMKTVNINDVVWRGYDDFTKGWAKCCVLTDTPNVKFLQCRWFQGGPTATPNSSIGVEINGTNGGDPAEFYFDQCEAFYGAQWIAAGSYVEGIRLTNCTVIGARALNWQAGAESGLVVVGGHFNCSAANFYLSGVFDVTICGANLYNEGRGANSHTMINILNGGRYAVTGCVFVSDTTATGLSSGVFVGNSAGGEAYGGLVDANTFHNFTNTAILFGGSSSYNTAGPGNIYRGCTARVTDTTGLNFINRKTHAFTSVVTFNNGGTSQSFTIALPAGLLLAKPEVVHVSSYDFSYLFSYDYNSSTATSLVFNGRNVAGSAIPSGTNIRVGVSVNY